MSQGQKSFPYCTTDRKKAAKSKLFKSMIKVSRFVCICVTYVRPVSSEQLFTYMLISTDIGTGNMDWFESLQKQGFWVC